MERRKENLLKGLKEMTFIKHFFILISSYILNVYDNKNRFSLFLSYVLQLFAQKFTSRSMGAILLEKNNIKEEKNPINFAQVKMSSIEAFRNYFRLLTFDV